MNLAKNEWGIAPIDGFDGLEVKAIRLPRPLSFLPPVIENNGDWNAFIGTAYRTYQDDFIVTPPTFMGKRVVVDKRLLDGKYMEGFWHVVQSDMRGDGDRKPIYERAERIPWIKPLIQNHAAEGVVYRRCMEGRREIRHYILAPSKNYAVILGEKKRAIFLVTAFCMNRSFMQRAIFHPSSPKERSREVVEMARNQ